MNPLNNIEPSVSSLPAAPYSASNEGPESVGFRVHSIATDTLPSAAFSDTSLLITTGRQFSVAVPERMTSITNSMVNSLGVIPDALKAINLKIQELKTTGEMLKQEPTKELVEEFNSLSIDIHDTFLENLKDGVDPHGFNTMTNVDSFLSIFHDVYDSNPAIFQTVQDKLCAGHLFKNLSSRMGEHKAALSPATDRMSSLENPAAGVSGGTRVIKATEGSNLGLVKIPQPVNGPAKEAPCFKLQGAMEIREVLTSLWNELLGGVSSYPLTLAITRNNGRTDTVGSIQVWRNGAQELAGSALDLILRNEDLFATSMNFLTSQKNPGMEKELKKDPQLKGLIEKHGLGVGMINKTVVTLDGRNETTRFDEALRDKSIQEQKDIIDGIPLAEAHKLFAFHLSTLQLDAENAANIMIKKGEGGKYHPFGIDGGLSMPDKLVPIDFNAPAWLKWQAAEKPWDTATIEKFRAVNVERAGTILMDIINTFPGAMKSIKEKPLFEKESMNRLKAAVLMMKNKTSSEATPGQTFIFIKNYLEVLTKETEKKLSENSNLIFSEVFNTCLEAKIAALGKVNR